MSTWPIWTPDAVEMLFAAATRSIETPKRAAMSVSVSPATTTYVRVALGESVVLVAPAAGIVSTWPIWTPDDDAMLFAAAMRSIETPKRAARSVSVSPATTTYLVVTGVLGVGVAVLEPGMVSTWPARTMYGGAMLLAAAICSNGTPKRSPMSESVSVEVTV